MRFKEGQEFLLELKEESVLNFETSTVNLRR